MHCRVILFAFLCVALTTHSAECDETLSMVFTPTTTPQKSAFYYYSLRDTKKEKAAPDQSKLWDSGVLKSLSAATTNVPISPGTVCRFEVKFSYDDRSWYILGSPSTFTAIVPDGKLDHTFAAGTEHKVGSPEKQTELPFTITIRRPRQLIVPAELSKQLNQIPADIFDSLEKSGRTLVPVPGVPEARIKQDHAANRWSSFLSPSDKLPLRNNSATFEVLDQTVPRWLSAVNRKYEVMDLQRGYRVESSAGQSVFKVTYDLMCTPGLREQLALFTYIRETEGSQWILTAVDRCTDAEHQGPSDKTSSLAIKTNPHDWITTNQLARIASQITIQYKLGGQAGGKDLLFPLSVTTDGTRAFLVIPGGTFPLLERILKPEASDAFVIAAKGKPVTFFNLASDSTTREVILTFNKPKERYVVVHRRSGERDEIPATECEIVNRDTSEGELLAKALAAETVDVRAQDYERVKVVPLLEPPDGLVVEIRDAVEKMCTFSVNEPNGSTTVANGWKLKCKSGDIETLTRDGKIQARVLRNILNKKQPVSLIPADDKYYYREIPLDKLCADDLNNLGNDPFCYPAEWDKITLRPNTFTGFCPGLRICIQKLDGAWEFVRLMSGGSDDEASPQAGGGAVYKLVGMKWERSSEISEFSIRTGGDKQRVYLEPIGLNSKTGTLMMPEIVKALREAATVKDDVERINRLNRVFPNAFGIDIALKRRFDGADLYTVHCTKKETIRDIPLLPSPWSGNFVGCTFSNELADAKFEIFRNGKPILTEFTTSAFLREGDNGFAAAQRDLTIHIVIVNGKRQYADLKQIWSDLRIQLARTIGSLEAIKAASNPVCKIYILSRFGDESLVLLSQSQIPQNEDSDARTRLLYGAWKQLEPPADKVGYGDLQRRVEDALAKDGSTVRNDDRVIIITDSDRDARQRLIGRRDFLECVVEVDGVDKLLRSGTETELKEFEKTIKEAFKSCLSE